MAVVDEGDGALAEQAATAKAPPPPGAVQPPQTKKLVEVRTESARSAGPP